MKGNLWLRSMLVLSMAQLGHLHAGTFHTIIGPDGRPIVVQKSASQNSKSSAKKQESNSVKAQTAVLSDNGLMIQKEVEVQQSHEANSQIKKQDEPVHSTSIKGEKTVSALSASEIHQPIAQASQEMKPASIVSIQQTAKASVAQSVPEKIPLTQSRLPAEILEIEGEQYVSNEVLEQREFNLEGKKRFYTMPEGIIDTKNGATRLQTVEREKGIGQSVMQALFKNNQQGKNEPLSLATTYYRISAETAAEGLGRSCFVDKKLKKAKDISVNQHVNLWPRASLKNEFDFEVVKLQQPLQNIQIQSFASRQNNPTFYWPFVVFLDQQGCILEGAGGFKNSEIAADYFQHTNIEGIIQVPSNSHYLLLTPLASAIDVKDRVLSNQGQLKLTGIR